MRNKADSRVRRGAVVKAMAIFSRYQYCEVSCNVILQIFLVCSAPPPPPASKFVAQVFRAPLVATLEEYYARPSVEVLQELFMALNAASLADCPRPNIVEQRIMHLGVCASAPWSTSRAVPPPKRPPISTSTPSSTLDYPLVDYTPGRWYYRTDTALFSSPLVPLSLALHASPDDVGAANLSFLLRVFQQQGAMRIFHAVLTRKRVLFVGYDHAAGDVCQMVLSAVAMVAPPLCGVIRRAYPYVNLTDLSFLEVSELCTWLCVVMGECVLVLDSS